MATKKGIKKVEVALAEDYLKDNNEFYPIGCLPISGMVWNQCISKIHLNEDLHCKIYSGDDKEGLQSVKQEHFLKLSDEIKNNIELICQLEYVLRDHPIEETKVCMELLRQQAIYWSQFTPICKAGEDDYTSITLDTNSPLLPLCTIPKILYSQGVLIRSTKEAAIVVHLITKICHKAGLENVAASFIEDAAPFAWNICERKGCLGVITEKSDMESALDVFIDSSQTAFWQIEKVYVQESIYEEFKLALSRKCNIKSITGHDKVPKNPTDSEFITGGKRFLIDQIDGSFIEENEKSFKNGKHPHDIGVEAYRTTKELLSLINSNYIFLSLWASDISEANEIAFSVPTAVVWINEYASFYGPPNTSLAIVLQINDDLSTKIHVNILKAHVNDLESKHNAWKKMSIEKRKEAIQNALIKSLDNEEVNRNSVFKMIKYTNEDKFKFIDVQNGKICIGIEMIKIGNILFESIENNVEACLQMLLNGCGCYIADISKDEPELEIFYDLYKAGVPVLIGSNDENRPNDPKTLISIVPYLTRAPEMKVIRSNFGTIFAN